MEIGIKRGYEILPNNNIIFGIKIINNTGLVISDVQVILDYNESFFKLQDDRIRKLGNIPPGTASTAKFTLEPTAYLNNEKIEATIIYRNPKWEKYMVDMRPKRVHSPSVKESIVQQTAVPSIQNLGSDKGNNSEKDVRKDEHEAATNNQSSQEDEIARMYNSYLKEVKSKRSRNEGGKTVSSVPYSLNSPPSDRKLEIPRTTTPSRKKNNHALQGSKKSRKITIRQALFIVIFVIIAIYLIQIPMIKERIGISLGGSGNDADKMEAITIGFLNAVNNSDYGAAFDMYQGKDFLVPASVELLFNNGGIEPESIKQIDIASNDIEGDTAVLTVNCTVASFDIFGKETDVSIISVYFQLNDIEQGWTVTSVSFVQPFEIKSNETAEVP